MVGKLTQQACQAVQKALLCPESFFLHCWDLIANHGTSLPNGWHCAPTNQWAEQERVWRDACVAVRQCAPRAVIYGVWWAQYAEKDEKQLAVEPDQLSAGSFSQEAGQQQQSALASLHAEAGLSKHALSLCFLRQMVVLDRLFRSNPQLLCALSSRDDSYLTSSFPQAPTLDLGGAGRQDCGAEVRGQPVAVRLVRQRYTWARQLGVLKDVLAFDRGVLANRARSHDSTSPTRDPNASQSSDGRRPVVDADAVVSALFRRQIHDLDFAFAHRLFSCARLFERAIGPVMEFKERDRGMADSPLYPYLRSVRGSHWLFRLVRGVTHRKTLSQPAGQAVDEDSKAQGSTDGPSRMAEWTLCGQVESSNFSLGGVLSEPAKEDLWEYGLWLRGLRWLDEEDSDGGEGGEDSGDEGYGLDRLVDFFVGGETTSTHARRTSSHESPDAEGEDDTLKWDQPGPDFLTAGSAHRDTRYAALPECSFLPACAHVLMVGIDVFLGSSLVEVLQESGDEQPDPQLLDTVLRTMCGALDPNVAVDGQGKSALSATRTRLDPLLKASWSLFALLRECSHFSWMWNYDAHVLQGYMAVRVVWRLLNVHYMHELSRRAFVSQVSSTVFKRSPPTSPLQTAGDDPQLTYRGAVGSVDRQSGQNSGAAQPSSTGDSQLPSFAIRWPGDSFLSAVFPAALRLAQSLLVGGQRNVCLTGGRVSVEVGLSVCEKLLALCCATVDDWHEYMHTFDGFEISADSSDHEQKQRSGSSPVPDSPSQSQQGSRVTFAEDPESETVRGSGLRMSRVDVADIKTSLGLDSSVLVPIALLEQGLLAIKQSVCIVYAYACHQRLEVLVVESRAGGQVGVRPRGISEDVEHKDGDGPLDANLPLGGSNGEFNQTLESSLRGLAEAGAQAEGPSGESLSLFPGSAALLSVYRQKVTRISLFVSLVLQRLRRWCASVVDRPGHRSVRSLMSPDELNEWKTSGVFLGSHHRSDTSQHASPSRAGEQDDPQDEEKTGPSRASVTRVDERVLYVPRVHLSVFYDMVQYAPAVQVTSMAGLAGERSTTAPGDSNAVAQCKQVYCLQLRRAKRTLLSHPAYRRLLGAMTALLRRGAWNDGSGRQGVTARMVDDQTSTALSTVSFVTVVRNGDQSTRGDAMLRKNTVPVLALVFQWIMCALSQMWSQYRRDRVSYAKHSQIKGSALFGYTDRAWQLLFREAKVAQPSSGGDSQGPTVTANALCFSFQANDGSPLWRPVPQLVWLDLLRCKYFICMALWHDLHAALPSGQGAAGGLEFPYMELSLMDCLMYECHAIRRLITFLDEMQYQHALQRLWVLGRQESRRQSRPRGGSCAVQCAVHQEYFKLCYLPVGPPSQGTFDDWGSSRTLPVPCAQLLPAGPSDLWCLTPFPLAPSTAKYVKARVHLQAGERNQLLSPLSLTRQGLAQSLKSREQTRTGAGQSGSFSLGCLPSEVLATDVPAIPSDILSYLVRREQPQLDVISPESCRTIHGWSMQALGRGNEAPGHGLESAPEGWFVGDPEDQGPCAHPAHTFCGPLSYAYVFKPEVARVGAQLSGQPSRVSPATPQSQQEPQAQADIAVMSAHLSVGAFLQVHHGMVEGDSIWETSQSLQGRSLLTPAAPTDDPTPRYQVHGLTHVGADLFSRQQSLFRTEGARDGCAAARLPSEEQKSPVTPAGSSGESHVASPGQPSGGASDVPVTPPCGQRVIDVSTHLGRMACLRWLENAVSDDSLMRALGQAHGSFTPLRSVSAARSKLSQRMAVFRRHFTVFLYLFGVHTRRGAVTAWVDVSPSSFQSQVCAACQPESKLSLQRTGPLFGFGQVFDPAPLLCSHESETSSWTDRKAQSGAADHHATSRPSRSPSSRSPFGGDMTSPDPAPPSPHSHSDSGFSGGVRASGSDSGFYGGSRTSGSDHPVTPEPVYEASVGEGMNIGTPSTRRRRSGRRSRRRRSKRSSRSSGSSAQGGAGAGAAPEGTLSSFYAPVCEQLPSSVLSLASPVDCVVMMERGVGGGDGSAESKSASAPTPPASSAPLSSFLFFQPFAFAHRMSRVTPVWYAIEHVLRPLALLAVESQEAQGSAAATAGHPAQTHAENVQQSFELLALLRALLMVAPELNACWSVGVAANTTSTSKRARTAHAASSRSLVPLLLYLCCRYVVIRYLTGSCIPAAASRRNCAANSCIKCRRLLPLSSCADGAAGSGSQPPDGTAADGTEGQVPLLAVELSGSSDPLLSAGRSVPALYFRWRRELLWTPSWSGQAGRHGAEGSLRWGNSVQAARCTALFLRALRGLDSCWTATGVLHLLGSVGLSATSSSAPVTVGPGGPGFSRQGWSYVRAVTARWAGLLRGSTLSVPAVLRGLHDSEAGGGLLWGWFAEFDALWAAALRCPRTPVPRSAWQLARLVLRVKCWLWSQLTAGTSGSTGHTAQQVGELARSIVMQGYVMRQCAARVADGVVPSVTQEKEKKKKTPLFSLRSMHQEGGAVATSTTTTTTTTPSTYPTQPLRLPQLDAGATTFWQAALHEGALVVDGQHTAAQLLVSSDGPDRSGPLAYALGHWSAVVARTCAQIAALSCHGPSGADGTDTAEVVRRSRLETALGSAAAALSQWAPTLLELMREAAADSSVTRPVLWRVQWLRALEQVTAALVQVVRLRSGVLRRAGDRVHVIVSADGQSSPSQLSGYWRDPMWVLCSSWLQVAMAVRMAWTAGSTTQDQQQQQQQDAAWSLLFPSASQSKTDGAGQVEQATDKTGGDALDLEAGEAKQETGDAGSSRQSAGSQSERLCGWLRTHSPAVVSALQRLARFAQHSNTSLLFGESSLLAAVSARGVASAAQCNGGAGAGAGRDGSSGGSVETLWSLDVLRGWGQRIGSEQPPNTAHRQERKTSDGSATASPSASQISGAAADGGQEDSEGQSSDQQAPAIKKAVYIAPGCILRVV